MTKNPSSLFFVRIFLVRQPGRLDAVRHMEPRSGQNGIIRNDFQYQGYDSDESDNDVLSVGAVQPLPDAASWDGAEIVEIGQRQADVVDDALLRRAQDLMDGPDTCCARMDDFDWVASPCVRELGLAEREMDVVLRMSAERFLRCRWRFRRWRM